MVISLSHYVDGQAVWTTGTFNSLAPGKFGCDFKNSIFNLVLFIGILKFLYDNALRWMPQNVTDDKSTLVQVMAWCRQATSHYLSQCWPRSMSPYGVIRPQWVNSRKDIYYWHGHIWEGWRMETNAIQNKLTHWGLKYMGAWDIWLTTFSNKFFRLQMSVIWLIKFNWIIFLKV